MWDSQVSVHCTLSIRVTDASSVPSCASFTLCAALTAASALSITTKALTVALFLFRNLAAVGSLITTALTGPNALNISLRVCSETSRLSFCQDTFTIVRRSGMLEWEHSFSANFKTHNQLSQWLSKPIKSRAHCYRDEQNMHIKKIWLQESKAASIGHVEKSKLNPKEGCHERRLVKLTSILYCECSNKELDYVVVHVRMSQMHKPSTADIVVMWRCHYSEKMSIELVQRFSTHFNCVDEYRIWYHCDVYTTNPLKAHSTIRLHDWKCAASTMWCTSLNITCNYCNREHPRCVMKPCICKCGMINTSCSSTYVPKTPC